MSGEVCWINRHFDRPELFVFVLGVTQVHLKKLEYGEKFIFFL